MATGTTRDGAGGPVFPSDGMSLRDYFAAKALNGLLSQPAGAQNVSCYDDADAAARWAYSFADAMLAERAK
jgi:hypothetical protein